MGRRFKIEVDNKALTHLNTSGDRTIHDWVEFILEFDFEIGHKRGILNMLPHNLSHMYRMLQLDWGHQTVPEGVTQVFNIGLLEVDDEGSDMVAKRVKEFVEEVMKKKTPSPKERRKVVEECHGCGHVGSAMLFRILFRNGYY